MTAVRGAEDGLPQTPTEGWVGGSGRGLLSSLGVLLTLTQALLDTTHRSTLSHSDSQLVKQSTPPEASKMALA